jgi:TPR repeat protein
MGRHLEAFQIYSKVLKIGHHGSLSTAQSSIARYHLCRDIQGIEYNPALAHSMLVALVESTNDPLAHYWLGSIYDEGIPGLFEIDRQKAFHHFLIAADAGDNDATFLVSGLCHDFLNN